MEALSEKETRTLQARIEQLKKESSSAAVTMKELNEKLSATESEIATLESSVKSDSSKKDKALATTQKDLQEIASEREQLQKLLNTT